MGWVATFTIGMLGAIAPEVLRMYKVRREPWQPVPRHYWAVSLAYCALGGVAALLLAQESNLVSAFYVCLALPVILGVLSRTNPVQGPGDGDSVEDFSTRQDSSFILRLSNYTGLV